MGVSDSIVIEHLACVAGWIGLSGDDGISYRPGPISQSNA